MGATNPANAAEGTICKRFASKIERNCIHGSDAPETAAAELAFSSARRNCFNPRNTVVLERPGCLRHRVCVGIRLAALLSLAASILAAQPDPLRDCKRQASISTNVALADIDARSNQDFILWHVRTGSQTVGGNCEADPRTGQIIRFERSPRIDGAADPERKRPDPIGDCRRHASVSSDTPIDDVGARRDQNFILWEAKSAGSSIAGLCEVHPVSERIIRFEAHPWEITDKLSQDDAEVTCQRAVRKKLDADEGEVATKFDRVESRYTYRVQWRYDIEGGPGKAGWCEIDSSTGRLRNVEAEGG